MRKRLKKIGKHLLRILLILLLAILIGVCWSVFRSKEYFPTLDSDVWGIDAEEDSLLMLLSKGEHNSLVRANYSGQVLNYAYAASNKAYHYFDVEGDTVYAILDTFVNGEISQQLVDLSILSTSMHPQVLLDLSSQWSSITWEQLYLTPTEEGTCDICLTGIDQFGQGYLLRRDSRTGRADTELILNGEDIYFLKYVRDGHYVWIGRDGHANQEIDGVRQYDVLNGQAESPYHISTCGTQVFLADSLTGDIFELAENGAAMLYRRGNDRISNTGYTYRQMNLFTTQLAPGGEICPIGFCYGGSGGVVVGDLHCFQQFTLGPQRILMILEHSILATLVSFGALLTLYILLLLIFRSHRLFVRLSACEIILAMILLGAMMVVQYASFQEALLESAKQKLMMIGGNLAYVLGADESADRTDLEDTVIQVLRQTDAAMGNKNAGYKVTVFWGGPDDELTIGYDNTIPQGCLARSVKSQVYLQLIQAGFAAGECMASVRNANNTDYIYVKSFMQGSEHGCVAVGQAEETIQAVQQSYRNRQIFILAVCPVAFLALILITWGLLHPLKDLREGMEDFYEHGSGNTVVLRMPQTELYEIGCVFNQLSLETSRQFNDLQQINEAYEKLVPSSLLQMLGKPSAIKLEPGDTASVDGALLIIVPETRPETADDIERFLEPAATHIQQNNGLVLDHDEMLGAVAAAFATLEQARNCACNYLTDTEGAMAAVFQEKFEIGVFGSSMLLYPLIVSSKLHRRQAVLSRLLHFGAVLVRIDNPVDAATLRLLGWDDGTLYYEDTAFRDGSWQSNWHEAKPLWDTALAAFKEHRYPEAMRLFAKTLRRLPGDSAARWYLFRCDDLRSQPEQRDSDTELLHDWRL